LNREAAGASASRIRSPAPRAGPALRLRPRLLVHPGRLERRRPLQAPETPVLGAQRGHFGAQPGVLLDKLQNQLLEVVEAEKLNIW